MNGSHLPASVQLRESGRNYGGGNLLGIQPWMTPADYASEQSLLARLSGYLEAAGRQGWLNPRTIVVFPEYLGTWLVIAGMGRAVTRATRLDRAMRALVLKRPVHVLAAIVAAQEQDRVAASLFRTRAAKMARAYQAIFSELARAFGVTVVAGSTVLPDPRIDEGRLVARRGLLYGVSAVFGPDGSAHPQLVRKVYPTSAELPFLAPGSTSELPLFDTPAGPLGVLICADSWYPDPYQHLRSQGVELIAVPSYAASKGCWDKPWRGYDGAAMPEDVDPKDVDRLTEAEAWRIHALAGRISESGARAGINVFLSGALWDLGAEGGSLMVTAGRAPVEVEPARAALLNLWL
jgi:predicted amidohydrolase